MQRIPDVLQNRLNLGQHRVIPIPSYVQTAGLKKSRPPDVALRRFGMLTAVKFDDESRFAAAEVDDIGRDRVLPTELPSGEASIPQQRPKQSFGIGLVFAQTAGESQDIVGQFQGTVVTLTLTLTLTPNPSPRGRGEDRLCFHVARPNRPAGLISSTMAMMTKITVLEASG
jgi:hypothetical protein